MNTLFDETFTNPEDNRSSRNIWYGYAKVSTQGAYGDVLALSDAFLADIYQLITTDLTTPAVKPTETNWYIYADMVTKDALEENIRPSLMIKETDGLFHVHLNFSDQDFAINLGAITTFCTTLQNKLNNHNL